MTPPAQISRIDSETPEAPPQQRATVFLFCAAVLLVFTVIIFADVLFAGDRTVVSQGADLYRRFAAWRYFGFSQMAGSNVPLWNPHIMGGVPFLAGFESALWYPLNWLFIVLPLAVAINISVALHAYLLALFTCLWAWRRELHPAACCFAGIAAMCCGAHIMHILPGHLALQCSMAWTPLVLLAVDELLDRPGLRWALVGTAAVALQVLAGNPQIVYYTALTAGIYGLFRIVTAPHRLRTLAAIGGMYVGGALLAAIQLVPSAEAAQYSVRSSGMPFEFITSGSLPWHNLITLIAPNAMGGTEEIPYWGEWYFWEVCVFVGTLTAGLAVYGAFAGQRRARRFSIWMALILLVLALGNNTHLFRPLVSVLPGLDRFRVPARFAFFASLFIAMLAAVGADRLIRKESTSWRAPLITAIAGLVVGGASWWIYYSVTHGATAWQNVLESVGRANISPAVLQAREFNMSFVVQSGRLASNQLFIAAMLILLLAGGLALRRVWKPAAYLVLIGGAIELGIFAQANHGTCDLSRTRPEPIAQFLQSYPGDYRILLPPALSNSGMMLGANEVWGYEIALPRRTMEFMAVTQGRDPNDVSEFFEIRQSHPWMAMLRGRYAFVPTNRGIQVAGLSNPLPHLLLMRDMRVLPDRDAIFAAMSSPNFNPRKTVILETAPNPAPAMQPSAGRDTARVVGESTDLLTIEADLKSPAVLLITDAWAPGWRAVSLDGSAQSHYDVLPADYILRAVPLSAGQHRFRLEYAPRGYVIGQWISLAALIVYVGLLGWVLWRRPKEDAL